jgi:pimeloyl-ACP methyl ester carboxylesterase
VPLAACRLPGLATAAWCGSVPRPLDPASPTGTAIAVHFAVLPAVSRVKRPDPVVFLAGGPGQSAIDLAGPAASLLGRLNNRRDIVLVDQRGTGRSAPLYCPFDAPGAAWRPLAEGADPARRLADVEACRVALQQHPHGDLRHYTTAIAMDDLRAVLDALGVARANLVGGSYGTRAGLEFARQFPDRVRRSVLDGIAPPDMVLPRSGGPDNQAALDAVFAACAAEAACASRHPDLQPRWRALLASLPREVEVPHPLTGRLERLTLTRDGLLGLVRAPLYVPSMASALPAAIEAATEGRLGPLAALASAVGGGPSARLSTGMHLSVICSEDLSVPDAARPDAAAAPDFGRGFEALYTDLCARWPRGTPPAGFHRIAPARSPVWLLSGGADPVTPPRHGERVAAALGPLARHAVVPQAGHGTLSIACVRDALVRFLDTESDADAAAVDLPCAQTLPRPPAFVPPGPAPRPVPALASPPATAAR